MGILGIDQDKCIKCGNCVGECRRFSKDEDQDLIVFSDPDNSCSWCWHCVAVCPENAILYENLGGEPEPFDQQIDENIRFSYESFHHVVKFHRSIRHYKKKPVPREMLEKIIDAMRYAPTGANMRSENYVVLSNKERMHELSTKIMEELLKNPGMRASYEENFARLRTMYENPLFFDAPHVIFAYSSIDLPIEDTNIGICLTYGRLAAESLGLGTCWNGWSQIAFESNKKIRRLAGVRSGSHFGGFVVGFPDVSFERSAPRSKQRVKWIE